MKRKSLQIIKSFNNRQTQSDTTSQLLYTRIYDFQHFIDKTFRLIFQKFFVKLENITENTLLNIYPPINFKLKVLMIASF